MCPILVCCTESHRHLAFVSELLQRTPYIRQTIHISDQQGVCVVSNVGCKILTYPSGHLVEFSLSLKVEAVNVVVEIPLSD